MVLFRDLLDVRTSSYTPYRRFQVTAAASIAFCCLATTSCCLDTHFQDESFAFPAPS